MRIFPAVLFTIFLNLVFIEGNAQNESEATVGIVDQTHARLFFEIDPEERYIKGDVRIQMHAKQSNQKELQLDLSSELSVNSVWWNGILQTSSSYTHSNNKLVLQLQEAISLTSTDSVRVQYQGVPPASSLEGFSQEEHESGAIVWTLSEPYSAKDWWPAQHNLADKVDSIDIWVASPVDNITASNGVLISREELGNKNIDHWKHKHPVATYLIAIAVSNYEVYSDFVPLEGKEVEVVNYIYPHYLSKAKRDSKHIIDIMQLFSRLFITYPFADEKYGHAQFSWGGGMEHQTMSFMYNLSFELQAHELAHQWFGNYITCNSWQDIWLNEGFATYLEGLCYENGLGEKDFRDWLRYEHDNVCSVKGGKLFVEDTTNVYRVFSGRLSYSKGAMVLHMLRQQIGSEAFFTATHNYLTDAELQNGFATTAKLQTHFEKATGTDLNYFFQDWIYHEGYPIYELDWAQTVTEELVLNLKQRSSMGDNNFFELKVPLTLHGKSESKKIWLKQSATNESFTIPTDFEVVSISVNNDYDIISKGSITRRDQKLALQTVDFSSTITAIPNPAKEYVEIFWNENFQPNTILLASPSGERILSVEISPGKLSHKILLQKYASGMYLVVAKNDSTTKQLKFIKQ